MKENYLKAIWAISLNTNKKASTNAIADEISTSAASVSDMLRKLQEKELIKYEKYKSVLKFSVMVCFYIFLCI